MKKPLDISELTIEQKIGQMMLARLPIDQESLDFTLELIRNRSLGGIHIMHKKAGPGFFIKDELDMMKMVLEAADYPILICEDMENGFQRGQVVLPYQMMVGASGSEEYAYEYGKIAAIEAKAAGYNLVFGPIVDIAENPESSCVGFRSYGGSKELVSRMAAATIRAYQDCGMIVTAKHFPGFGPSPVDSHIGMVVLHGDEENLLENGIYPYTYAMEHADLSGVMMGHILAEKIDPELPASVSPKVIGLLRKQGFDGLIMTDSFAMIGMRTLYTDRECYQLAMAAGNDMVMGNYRSSVKDLYQAMLDAYHSGMVTESQIDAAAARVIHAQKKTMEPSKYSELTEQDRKAAEEMCAKAICADCRDGVSAALDKQERYLFVLQEGNQFYNPVTKRMEQDVCDLHTYESVLREKFPNSDFVTLPEFPIKPQIEDFLDKTLGYEHIVFTVLTKSVSYTGSADCTKRMIAVIDGVRKKTDAVVLFGNPYAAREFGEIPRIVYGFDGATAQKYTALALAGEHPVTGVLPVDIYKNRVGE